MKLKISQIADIHTGYQFRGKVEENPQGSVRFIQVKDIDAEHRLQTGDLIAVQPDRDPAPYFVREGDVLFLSRGHHLGATLIDQQLENTMATGYFLILRVMRDVVSPAFLAWFLNQSAFQERLKPFVQGSYTPMLSRADFESMAIDIPPPDVQEKIVALDDLARKERRLLNHLQEKRAALVQAVSMKTIRESTRRKGKKQ